MNKKIFLTCLAAGILVFLLPAREVKAAENQTTEDYYYQLLINGEYPYNTAANAGTGVPVPAGGWEQMVAMANQQLTQAVARQQSLEAARQNLDVQLQAAAYSQQAALLNQQAALSNQGTAGVPLTVPALTTDTILQVQNLLNFYGSSCSPTGVYDAQTQAALFQFQTKYGLVADGTINAQVLQLFGLG